MFLWLIPFVILATGERVESRPEAPARVALVPAAFSSDEMTVQAGPLGRARVEAAWVSVRNIRFQRRCRSSGTTAQIRGQVVIEMVSSRAAGLPDRVEVAPGRVCRVDADFRPPRGRVDGAPPELRDRSLVVLGRRDDGVPFVIRTRRTDVLKLWARESDGFALRSGEARIFLAVDLARWMEGVDLQAAAVNDGSAGRRIEIDERSNAELLARFEANVPPGLRLYRDEDGDGMLGPDERAAGRELAAGQP